MAFLRGAFTKLALPPEEIRAENLRRWAATIQGAKRIADFQARERGCVAGVVQNVRIDPREGSGSIEATIIDGTGRMTAKWLGRSSLEGVRLGMGLVVQGIAGVGTDGELVFLNPEYELVLGPEHG